MKCVILFDCPDFSKSGLKHLVFYTFRYPGELAGIETKRSTRLMMSSRGFADIEHLIRLVLFLTSQKIVYNSPTVIYILKISNRI